MSKISRSTDSWSSSRLHLYVISESNTHPETAAHKSSFKCYFSCQRCLLNWNILPFLWSYSPMKRLVMKRTHRAADTKQTPESELSFKVWFMPLFLSCMCSVEPPQKWFLASLNRRGVFSAFEWKESGWVHVCLTCVCCVRALWIQLGHFKRGFFKTGQHSLC